MEYIAYFFVVFLVGYIVSAELLALALCIAIVLEVVPINPDIYALSICIILATGLIHGLIKASQA